MRLLFLGLTSVIVGVGKCCFRVVCSQLQFISEVLAEGLSVDALILVLYLVEDPTAKEVVPLEEEVDVLEVVQVDACFCHSAHQSIKQSMKNQSS